MKFQEKQQFPRWLQFFIIALAVLNIGGMLLQLYVAKSVLTGPVPKKGLLILAVSIGLLMFALTRVKLHTEIDNQGLQMRFFPFAHKNIPWAEIASMEITEYSFINGIGVHYSFKHGWVYNVAGTKGLAVHLKNGKRFVIGSQKTKELEAFLVKKNRHKVTASKVKADKSNRSMAST